MITVKELVNIEFPVVIFTEGFSKMFHNFEEVCKFFDEQLENNKIENEDSTKFFGNLLKTMYVEDLYQYQKREYKNRLENIFDNNEYVFKLIGSCNYIDVCNEYGSLFVDGNLYTEVVYNNFFEEFLAYNEFSINFEEWISENFLCYNDKNEFEEWIITETP